MTETLAAAPVRPTSPTRRAAVVTSVVALVLGALELVACAVMWWLTATDPSDDPLVALGYLVALVFGVPGAIAMVLGGLGWLFACRSAGLVLAVLSVVTAAGPVLMVVTFALPF